MKKLTVLTTAFLLFTSQTLVAMPGQGQGQGQCQGQGQGQGGCQGQGMGPKVISEEMIELKTEQAQLKSKEKLLRLKTALNLRENQMSAWNSYENFMMNSSLKISESRVQMHKRRMEQKAPPTSVEMGEMHITKLEEKLANAKQKQAVFSKLYKNLDDTQKQTVDKMAHKKVKRMAKKLRKARKGDKKMGR